jgi:ATP-dependent protease HslVU (ClpYQ) peptidase subunit
VENFHGTTILTVRRGGTVVVGGDGQVTLGDTIMKGKGRLKHIEEMKEWGNIIKSASRCGLGQTAPNPILTTLENFKEDYEAKINDDGENELFFDFNLKEKIIESCQVVGREPVIE